MIDKAADGTRDINIKLEEIRNSASGFEENAFGYRFADKGCRKLDFHITTRQ